VTPSERINCRPLALVVGLAFGIYHVALFRFMPTAALGVMLAAVTLLTGSIFPVYLIGAGLLAPAFWIFWCHRTPYPGLRPFPRN
jgi:hypothetical protein